MDCFASLAMTADRNDFAFSRRDAPGVLHFVVPPKDQRAQGRPGARCTRGLACNVHQKMRTRAYRFSGNTPASPTQWLYGLYEFAPVTGFLATVITRIAPHNLTPAPGRQAHTTSPYAWATLVSRSLRVHRIPPHGRDDRDRPSCCRETGEVKLLICPTREAKYFCAKGWTDFW
jgi:hypothetical protein